ncbi:MAG: hypothetical protein MK008_12795 [Bdellovibrionales bacterium]|nr:hypothetical protein [Bdellovibrionales bacterium]
MNSLFQLSKLCLISINKYSLHNDAKKLNKTIKDYIELAYRQVLCMKLQNKFAFEGSAYILRKQQIDVLHASISREVRHG